MSATFQKVYWLTVSITTEYVKTKQMTRHCHINEWKIVLASKYASCLDMKYILFFNSYGLLKLSLNFTTLAPSVYIAKLTESDIEVLKKQAS